MSPPGSDVLLRELDPHGVLLLTFNRPERNNGWTLELEEEYFGALIAAANDTEVRTIVVTGAGRSFCPGLDMHALEASAKEQKPLTTGPRWPMTTAWRIPKPIIAAVNGACAGIGFVQAACCDLRFAATTAKFTSAFARRGLPAENGISWLLPRLIGTPNALDLLLSGRVVMAEEACRLGFVNQVHEPDDLVAAALDYARDLAVNCSPVAMAMAKQQVHDDWARSAEEARFQSLILMSETTGTHDFSEGVTSFQERRAPQFEGYAAGLHVPRAVTR